MSTSCFAPSPPENVVAQVTMHFRFGASPGDVCLEDVRVVDLDCGGDTLPLCDFENGRESIQSGWTVWPTGEANTAGTVQVEPGCGGDGSAGLHVRLKAPPDGRWPDARAADEIRPDAGGGDWIAAAVTDRFAVLKRMPPGGSRPARTGVI